MESMESLNTRLTRLERENRRLKLMGMVALVLIGVVLITGGLNVEDPVVGAEAFTLVDKDGNLRAVFAMVNGEPTLAMFDGRGGMRAGLSVVEGVSRFVLYGEDGNAVWSAP